MNYNADANTDDGSCIAVVSGCMDDTYVEYNSEANTDDGSCVNKIVLGCTDNTAFNYNPIANTDDGSCEAVLEGCTDETACNYNVSANTDDSTCEIPVGCEYCSGKQTVQVQLSLTRVMVTEVTVDETEIDQILIYPNPSSHYVTLLNVDASSAVIYDIAGQKLQLSQNVDRSINISHLSSGIYTLQVTDEQGQQFFTKLIKK